MTSSDGKRAQDEDRPKPGPDPDRLKIELPWEEAVKKVVRRGDLDTDRESVKDELPRRDNA